MFAVNGPKIKRPVSEEAVSRRADPREALRRFWEGTGQAAGSVVLRQASRVCCVSDRGATLLTECDFKRKSLQISL